MMKRVGAVWMLAALAACSSGGSANHTHQHAETFNGKPDAVIAGPQGNLAQFVVECAFSHAAQDDPIVHPGKPGNSHLHVFFGNDSTDAFSTVASLDEGGTTCDQRLDRASYWAPALMRDGAMVQPVKSTAYYRAGIGVDPTIVQPYPHGLMMIAGNAAATQAQPLEVVSWSCGTGSMRSVTPPECPPGRGLRMLVVFPDCWDNAHLDTANHIDHIAYSAQGQCPTTHPVSIPQLQFSIEYPITGPTDGLLLASGALITGHADFFDAWEPAKLADEVRLCLHRGVVCGIASGRTDG